MFDQNDPSAIEPLEQEAVPFHGESIIAVRLPDDRICVVLRWICESLSLKPTSQVQRIQRTAAIANELVRVRVLTSGGKQTMPAITLRGFPVWILGINPNEVKDERLKEMIIAYQVEAVDVLYNHFSKRRLALPESQAIVPSELVRPVEPTLDSSHDEWIVYHQQMTRWHQQLQDIEIKVQQVEQRQGNIETRVGSLEKIVGSILPHVGKLSTAHRATAQKMVNEISRISGVKHQYIWGDLKDAFHAPSYTDIPDEKWAEVQKWLQQRLDSAKQGKGIEQQPSLFNTTEEN